MPTEGSARVPVRAAGRILFMDEGFSGVARTWSDGASGGDLVQFLIYPRTTTWRRVCSLQNVQTLHPTNRSSHGSLEVYAAHLACFVLGGEFAGGEARSTSRRKAFLVVGSVCPKKFAVIMEIVLGM